MYRLSWELSKVNVNELTPAEPKGVVVTEDEGEGEPLATFQQVFSYRSAHIEELQLHLYTLMFWRAFAFCLAFEDPSPAVRSTTSETQR